MHRPSYFKYIDRPVPISWKRLPPKTENPLRVERDPGECRDKYPESNLEACFEKSSVMFDVYEFVLLSAFYEIAF